MNTINNIKHWLFISITLVNSIAAAQSISPNAITSAGSSVSQSNVIISYIVGDITVESISNGNVNLGQGFTSSAVQSTTITAIQEPNTDVMQVKLYPNPTSDLLYLDIESSKEPFIQISIIDINGKILSNETYSALNNHIGVNTQYWQAGSYLLQLSNTNGKLLGSYTILKK